MKKRRNQYKLLHQEAIAYLNLQTSVNDMNIPKDGNCFFHCLSYYLKISHTELRQMCVEYLQENTDFCKVWAISENEICFLKVVGNWYNNAMDVIPLVACNVFNLRLIIENRTTGCKYILEPENSKKIITQINLVRVVNHYEINSY